MFILSFDIGTQGTKAALFTHDMKLVATAFKESRLISPKPGVVWQEPDDLVNSCIETTREILEKSVIPASKIGAIGIDGQMAGIIGIGPNGEATTYYDSWLDMRCGKYVEQMNARAGKRIIELSGGPVTYNHGPKILWWKNEQPDIYKKTAKFIMPQAYVAGRMTGLTADRAYFDHTHLHFSCLADNKNKVWSDELLETFDIEKEKMARIVSPFEVIGKVTAGFASVSGLVEGIPVVAGCGDTAASTFGTGMFKPGMVLDCAGTASVLSGVVESYVPDTANETLIMMRSPIEEMYIPLAYINGGGMCIRWFRDTLTGKPATASYSELQAEAETVEPGSDGLIFIPHFSGRVLPNNPHMKGSFTGLDFKHTRGHMYRAIMEAIAYEYKYYLSVLRTLYPGNSFGEMLTVGGGSNSSLFNQIKADVLGIPVTTLETGDTSLLGSAVIAAVGTGILSDYRQPIMQAVKKAAFYNPDMEKHKVYEACAEAYLKAIEQLSPLYYDNISKSTNAN